MRRPSPIGSEETGSYAGVWFIDILIGYVILGFSNRKAKSLHTLQHPQLLPLIIDIDKFIISS